MQFLLLFTLVYSPNEKLESISVVYSTDTTITATSQLSGQQAIKNKSPSLFPVTTDPPDPSFYLDTPISLKEEKGVSQAKNIYDGNGEVLGFLIPVQYQSNYT
ncbi:hypothetical protein [Halobacillus litoralis]|uniref:Uncharacterized protein n=1 Tax=Halobacillus litoralis TaxID=45668 RepID=A0A410MDL4_9BACI|nr:hypothetical protein [Halobacillus litoralis]QAS52787.1 hypothetical protein HLI_11565 [Halobacillus litoralis]